LPFFTIHCYNKGWWLSLFGWL